MVKKSSLQYMQVLDPVSGDVFERFVPNYVGFGSFRKLSGASESVTFNQTRSRCSSRLSEKVQKEFSSEKSKGGQLHSLVHLEIHYSHSQSNHLFRRRSVAYSSPLIAVLLVLVHSSDLVEQQNLLELYHRTSSVQGLWRFYQQNLRTTCWFWFTQKTIGCGRICYSIQTRSNVFVHWAGAENQLQEKSVRVDYSSIWRSRCPGQICTHREGTISVSGDAHTTRARDFVGFGTIPTLSGSGISYCQPDERNLLFSFHGERISRNLRQENLEPWQVHSTRNFWRSSTHIRRTTICQD